MPPIDPLVLPDTSGEALHAVRERSRATAWRPSPRFSCVKIQRR